jgi:Ser/Thr protein kinase RdoA (MazF antagonist)
MLLIDVARQFANVIVGITPLGNGHINDTYFVETGGMPFVLQKVNKNVFPNPGQIMVNLLVLNQHIRESNLLQVKLKIPELLFTDSGSEFYQDDQGDYWRALSYIENTESLETISNLSEAEQVGLALGRFHRLASTLAVEKLYDTLPGFHICPSYLEHYQTVKEAAKVPENKYCADFIASHQHIAKDLETAKELGLLSIRIIHGDPKLNNFLFDKDSRHIVSIIDLDTVKPGLVHYDIGDCIRSCCHNTTTDTFDLKICKAILISYLKAAGDFFSENDYQFLYPAIRLIPFELGLRFYTDYLDGNRYFKISEPEENLSRATAQFRLCASVMAQETEIKRLIKSNQFQ